MILRQSLEPEIFLISGTLDRKTRTKLGHDSLIYKTKGLIQEESEQACTVSMRENMDNIAGLAFAMSGASAAAIPAPIPMNVTLKKTWII